MVHRPDIYRYHNIRTYFQDWLAYRRVLIGRYSYRTFSKSIGFSCGYLPLILARKRRLTENFLSRAVDVMELSESEVLYLKLLRILNEAKSVIIPKSALITEEPDLEALFAAAVAEISNQIDDDDFDIDYGFQSEWDDEETDQEDLELQATTLLFDSHSEYPGHEENIERFCLPLFLKAGSDYAVEHVMDSFKKRPSMSQIYASYLAKFLDTDGVHEFQLGLLKDREPEREGQPRESGNPSR